MKHESWCRHKMMQSCSCLCLLSLTMDACTHLKYIFSCGPEGQTITVWTIRKHFTKDYNSSENTTTTFQKNKNAYHKMIHYNIITTTNQNIYLKTNAQKSGIGESSVVKLRDPSEKWFNKANFKSSTFLFAIFHYNLWTSNGLCSASLCYKYCFFKWNFIYTTLNYNIRLLMIAFAGRIL